MAKPNWLKNDKRVKDWDREPDGICVVTEYGFAFDPDPDHRSAGHIHIYSSAREARSELKLIQPCTCLRCTSKGRLA